MDSLVVLRRDPELATFPLVAGVAGLVYLGVLLGGVSLLVGALGAGATVILIAYLAGVTLGGIARTALYVYATEGKKPSEFDNVDFTRPK